MKAPVAAALAVVSVLVAGCVSLVGGFWLMAARSASAVGTCASAARLSDAVPAQLVPIFQAAATRYRLGPQGASILAGLTKIESDFGQNLGPSSAGAVGWTQFMPATWRPFGVDADDDGTADPDNPLDAIYSAARYLRHLGAPADWHQAIFGYNHSDAYVHDVLAAARTLSHTAPATDIDLLACTTPTSITAGSGGRLVGGGRIVSIPGQPGMSIDERILPDIQALQRLYHFTVTAGYAPTGHAAGGEHPLGLAVDLVPGPGGSWDDIDALAHWAEPRQNHPRPPFRWVGYNGDPGHGRGNHLHLSWMHGPAPARRPPAPWVEVLIAP